MLKYICIQEKGKKMNRMKDFLALPNDELVKTMEIFEKLEDCINNYENVAAVYGYNHEEAKEVLYRGVRNAFLYGKWYAEERARMEEK